MTRRLAAALLMAVAMAAVPASVLDLDNVGRHVRRHQGGPPVTRRGAPAARSAGFPQRGRDHLELVRRGVGGSFSFGIQFPMLANPTAVGAVSAPALVAAVRRALLS